MLEFKQATGDDIALLENMYLEEVEDHKERARTFADDLVNHFKTILAFKEGEFCGNLTWDTRGGYDDGVVEIIGLGVNERFQRQGVARGLVNYFTQEASNFYSSRGYVLRVIILFMEDENEVARKFYSNVGFTEAARISKLYPHDDGIIWTKHI